MKTKIFMVGIVVSIVFNIFSFYKDNLLHFYFLNVGQGDSILIETPDHKFMLVDGGPDDSVLSQLNEVLPFWVKTLDYVVLSHPDADHITGVVEVLKYYKVKKLIFNEVNKDSNGYREFLRTIDEESIQVEQLRSSGDFNFGCCVFIDVLWPEPYENLMEEDSVNNTSFSFILSYMSFKSILAGDNEAASEDEIASHNNIKSTLLKVDHHGSTTSTTDKYLNGVDPEIAIIQVGKDNKFHHPRPEILEKLSKKGVKVYRNDLNGRIEVTTNGETYEVECQKDC